MKDARCVLFEWNCNLQGIEIDAIHGLTMC